MIRGTICFRTYYREIANASCCAQAYETRCNKSSTKSTVMSDEVNFLLFSTSRSFRPSWASERSLRTASGAKGVRIGSATCDGAKWAGSFDAERGFWPGSRSYSLRTGVLSQKFCTTMYFKAGTRASTSMDNSISDAQHCFFPSEQFRTQVGLRAARDAQRTNARVPLGVFSESCGMSVDTVSVYVLRASTLCTICSSC